MSEYMADCNTCEKTAFKTDMVRYWVIKGARVRILDDGKIKFLGASIGLSLGERATLSYLEQIKKLENFLGMSESEIRNLIMKWELEIENG